MQNLIKDSNSKVNMRRNTVFATGTNSLSSATGKYYDCISGTDSLNQMTNKDNIQQQKQKKSDSNNDLNKTPISPIWKPRIISQYGNMTTTSFDTQPVQNENLKEKSKKRIKFNFGELTNSKSYLETRSNKFYTLRMPKKTTSDF